MDYQALDALRVTNQVAQAKHDATQDLILALTADGQLSPQQVRAAQAACQPYKVAADAAHRAYMDAHKSLTSEVFQPKATMAALRLAARHRRYLSTVQVRNKRKPYRRLLSVDFDKPALSALV